jgi:hypothetical protein
MRVERKMLFSERDELSLAQPSEAVNRDVRIGKALATLWRLE